jgi:hypothetical protein
MELTLFKNWNIVAEVYKYHRYNILQNGRPLPTTMGLESGVSANFGTADSKGIDFQTDYKQSLGGSGWIQARGNFTIGHPLKYDKYEEPQYAEAYRYQSGQDIKP